MAEQVGYNNILLLDGSLLRHELTSFPSYIDDHTDFILAFDNNAFRLEWINKLQTAGTTLSTLIHPTAYVSPKASLQALSSSLI